MLEEERNTAVAILNIVLTNIGSTNKVGAKVEIYPLDEYPHSHTYNIKVDNQTGSATCTQASRNVLDWKLV